MRLNVIVNQQVKSHSPQSCLPDPRTPVTAPCSILSGSIPYFVTDTEYEDTMFEEENVFCNKNRLEKQGGHALQEFPKEDGLRS